MRQLFLVFSVLLTLFLCAQTHTSSPRNTPGWDVLSPMKTGRSEIAAAVLGDRVYVAGGIGFFQALESCEVYHLPEDRWSRCTDLPVALHHVALASDGEYVYAAGGYSELNFGHYRDAKLWRLEDDQWKAIADLAEPIGEHSMVGYEGALLLIGGRSPKGDSDALRKYEPITKKWMSLAPLPVARHSFAAFIAGDELWVTGGRSAALGTQIRRIDIYNFKNDRWRQGPDLPTGRGGHAAAYVDGKVHIIGGEIIPSRSGAKFVDAHEVYDMAAQDWLDAPLMPLRRHGHVAVNYQNEVYVFGGGAKPALKTAWTASPSVQRFRPKK